MTQTQVSLVINHNRPAADRAKPIKGLPGIKQHKVCLSVDPSPIILLSQTRGGSGSRSHMNKSRPKPNLLQSYRDHRLSGPIPDSILSTYIDNIVGRLVGPGRAKHTDKEALRTIVQKLAKYNDLFERLLEYAEDSARRDFSVRSRFHIHQLELTPGIS